MKQNGFTLIEVLISMMIVATAVVALSFAARSSALNLQKARNMTTANTLLQQKATEFEYKYQKEFPTEKTQESGDFGKEYPNFAWRVQVQPLEFPDLTPILTANEADGASDMMITVIRQMTDYFSKAVFEMKVVVIWKHKRKDIEYDITTYLVNYETDLAFGG